MIIQKMVAEKLAQYLSHQLSLNELVDWAENGMLNEPFDERDHDTSWNDSVDGFDLRVRRGEIRIFYA